MLRNLLLFVEGLRSAGETSLRLTEIERRQTNLEQEWSDVIDKMVAREERQRKRDAKRLRDAGIEEVPEGMEDPAQLTIPGTPFLRRAI